MRETLKVLDTKCEVLKYENKYLRSQVNVLKEKVEMLEKTNKDQELKVSSELDHFKKRLNGLESQTRVKHSKSPQISISNQDSNFILSAVNISSPKSYVPPFGICQD